jgi:NADPH:quinone reductase-like Zn-dependent oxidoreductase
MQVEPETPSRKDQLAHKSANVSFEQAAVVPVSTLRAVEGPRDAGRGEPGTVEAHVDFLVRSTSLSATMAGPALT